MGNIGSGEVLVILLVGLIVLGPTKLPNAVRQVGRFVGEIRRISAGFRQELQDVVDEPVRQTRATIAEADPRNVIKHASSANRKFNSGASVSSANREFDAGASVPPANREYDSAAAQKSGTTTDLARTDLTGNQDNET